MISAFGIEHGEISKLRAPRLPGGGRPSRAQVATRGPAGSQTGPQKVKGALNRIGETDVSLKSVGSGAGRALKGVGNFLEQRPGLTGTALVGGGGAGGYKYLSEKKPKKKSRS